MIATYQSVPIYHLQPTIYKRRPIAHHLLQRCMISDSKNKPLKEPIMSEKRDAYVDKLKAQIDEWNAEVAKLEAQAKKAQADARALYLEEVDQLNKRLAEGRQMLKEIQGANEAALNDLMEGAERMWSAFEEAFKKARSRYK